MSFTWPLVLGKAFVRRWDSRASALVERMKEGQSPEGVLEGEVSDEWSLAGEGCVALGTGEGKVVEVSVEDVLLDVIV